MVPIVMGYGGAEFQKKSLKTCDCVMILFTRDTLRDCALALAQALF
jgi:hypothetical protein